MRDDNDEKKVPPSENSSSEKDRLEVSKDPPGPLHIKEKDVMLWFCILLAIVGIVLAARTGNQWWLTLLGPFSIIIKKKERRNKLTGTIKLQ